VALSIPLGLSLRDIAYEARVRDVARDQLNAPFAGSDARVTDFDVTFPRSGPDRIKVRATVLTGERVFGVDTRVAEALSTRFRRNVSVVLDQVIVDDDVSSESARLAAVAESSFGAPMRAQIAQLEALAVERRTEREVRAAFPYALAAAEIDPAARRAVFTAAPTEGVGLPAFRRLEEGLARNFPDWEMRVFPPRTELPPVSFAAESDEPAPEQVTLAADLAWALQRWGVAEVEVVAFLPTAAAANTFNENALGHRRASAVAAELAKAGITAAVAGEFRTTGPGAEDREAALRRANQIVIRPAG